MIGEVFSKCELLKATQELAAAWVGWGVIEAQTTETAV